jgi:hypothetical protein
MTDAGCPFGLCEPESTCRYCSNGGRTMMASGNAQDHWVRYVDAQRECLRLSMRNVLLVQQVDALRKEVDNSRKVMDDAKALAAALYRGEG